MRLWKAGIIATAIGTAAWYKSRRSRRTSTASGSYVQGVDPKTLNVPATVHGHVAPVGRPGQPTVPGEVVYTTPPDYPAAPSGSQPGYSKKDWI